MEEELRLLRRELLQSKLENAQLKRLVTEAMGVPGIIREDSMALDEGEEEGGAKAGGGSSLRQSGRMSWGSSSVSDGGGGRQPTLSVVEEGSEPVGPVPAMAATRPASLARARATGDDPLDDSAAVAGARTSQRLVASSSSVVTSSSSELAAAAPPAVEEEAAAPRGLVERLSRSLHRGSGKFGGKPQG